MLWPCSSFGFSLGSSCITALRTSSRDDGLSPAPMPSMLNPASAKRRSKSGGRVFQKRALIASVRGRLRSAVRPLGSQAQDSYHTAIHDEKQPPPPPHTHTTDQKTGNKNGSLFARGTYESRSVSVTDEFKFTRGKHVLKFVNTITTHTLHVALGCLLCRLLPQVRVLSPDNRREKRLRKDV